jgi:hypothetical protein
MPGGAIRARVPQKPWNDADRGLRRSQRSALAKNGLIIARRLRLSGDEAEKQEEEEKRQSEDQDFAQELFPPDTVASRSNLLLAGSLPCRILPGILREVGGIKEATLARVTPVGAVAEYTYQVFHNALAVRAVRRVSLTFRTGHFFCQQERSGSPVDFRPRYLLASFWYPASDCLPPSLSSHCQKAHYVAKTRFPVIICFLEEPVPMLDEAKAGAHSRNLNSLEMAG